MARPRIKVKVGQRWTGRATGRVLTITEVTSGAAKHINEKGKVQIFCYLDSDGCTEDDGNWDWEDPPEEIKPTVTKTSGELDVVAFFKSVPSGNCPCNVPRESCEYHKQT